MEKSIGALWLNKSKDKKVTYMSGIVEINGQKINIVVFKNKFKDKDEENNPDINYPDYKIYLSEKKEQKKPEPPKQHDDFEDDIPF